MSCQKIQHGSSECRQKPTQFPTRHSQVRQQDEETLRARQEEIEALRGGTMEQQRYLEAVQHHHAIHLKQARSFKALISTRILG